MLLMLPASSITISKIQSINYMNSLYSHFINYCFTKKHYMDKQNPYQDDLTISIKPRDFKCPCGKTYLSYAALFTHVKQKHQGKAPGKIIKPPSQHEKRGRPPVKSKNQKKEADKTVETNHPAEDLQAFFPPQTSEERFKRQQLAQLAIQQAAQVVEQMPNEQLNKAHLNQIEVFSQMSVYLNTRVGPPSYAHGNICIADGFLQFARLVCSKITWAKFQPFYLLFMLFLQYVMDNQNNKKILTQNSMDLLCEQINEFIENHMRDMAQYYQLEDHWLIRKQNSIRIFLKFFKWCMNKRYVTYKINLANQQQKIKDQHGQFRGYQNLKME